MDTDKAREGPNDGDGGLGPMSEAEVKELIARSRDAMKNSYCEYSNFRVGAALLTEDGSTITGCNIENVSYSLTNCAERTAIFKAVSEGHRKFKAIAISSDLKENFIYPCGACRQVMVEFGDFHVYACKPDLTWQHTTTQKLIPYVFTKPELHSVQKSKAQK
ncbi:hypothetical protein BsWGS_26479 [Bradybaena similaris]